MNFIEFQSAFSNSQVISVIEIEKTFPGYDKNALTRWQKKGYLKKIKSGYYRLSNQPLSGEQDLFFIANQIYFPSYISLHSALRWYDFIPEGVFLTTSVSTKKTQTFQTDFGAFMFRSIQRELFFGYRLEKFKNFNIKIADPSKAILDLLYLSPHLESEDDFLEMRFNFWELQKQFDLDKFENYLSLFSSKSLKFRANKFTQFIKNHVITT